MAAGKYRKENCAYGAAKQRAAERERERRPISIAKDPPLRSHKKEKCKKDEEKELKIFERGWKTAVIEHNKRI